MKRMTLLLAAILASSALAEAQTTIYLLRDTIYAGPGGGAIATVTPPPSDTSAPTAPSNLGVTSTTATSVALSWTGSTDSGGSGLLGYVIYRQKGSGANLPVGSVNSGTTAFPDLGPLEPSTAYTFTIVAVDVAGNRSSASNSVNPTTSSSSGDTTAPTAPSNLRGIPTTRQSTYKVRLDWDAATDAGGSGVAGYRVYYNDTLISGETPITTRYYEVSTETANTTYTPVRVKAVDGAGNASSYSNSISVTTLRELVLSENFNHADGYFDFDDFMNLNNTFQQKIRWTPGTFADHVFSNSQNTFAASVKVLARDGAGTLNSGFTFWGTPGTGDPEEFPENYCYDIFDYWTPWAPNTGLYRIYETEGGYLRLDYWTTCDENDASILVNSAEALPTGPGTLTVDVNHSTRRIKAYWNGVLKIDYTDTNTSRPNSGAIALSGAATEGVPGAIFDDLLLEK